MGVAELRVIGLGGLPDVRPGDDIAALILEAAEGQGIRLVEGDVLVVTQKIVSKAEGRVVALADVEPGTEATRLARGAEEGPRLGGVVLRGGRRSWVGG